MNNQTIILQFLPIVQRRKDFKVRSCSFVLRFENFLRVAFCHRQRYSILRDLILVAYTLQ